MTNKIDKLISLYNSMTISQKQYVLSLFHNHNQGLLTDTRLN